MFCKNCGEYNDDNANFCAKCGASLKEKPADAFTGNVGSSFLDTLPDWLLALGAFFFPIIAIILYFVERSRSVHGADVLKKWAIIGIIVEVVIFVATFIFSIVLTIGISSGAYVALF